MTGEPLSPRTDVYALGCVAYHCLAGEPPFPGDSPVQVASARTVAPAPPLGLARPDLPVALCAAVDRALARRPEDRWSTAGDLARAVRRSLEPRRPRPVPAPEPAQVEQTAPLPVPPLPDPTPDPGPMPAPRRRPSAAVLAGAGAVLAATLVGGGLGLASGEDSGGTGPAPTPAQALEALLPPDVVSSCTAQPPAAGQVAALSCRSTAPGADEVIVRRFADAPAMAAAFVDRTVGKYDPLPCSDFAGGPPGSGHRSTWGPEDAPLACYVNVNGHAVVLWEHPDRAVQLLAIRKDADAPALFRWWSTAKDVPLRG